VSGFERRVVSALTTSTDPGVRDGVAAWVEASLHDMPEHLRAGVLAQSVALGAWARLRGQEDAALLRSFERSPLWPVRQYLRLLRSLVIFAEQELAPA
jgi:hypothetical protein